MKRYPSLYDAANMAAARAQARFASVTALSLISLVGATGLSVPHSQTATLGACALLCLAFASTLSNRILRFDDQWFVCRALAENIKSSAWFYVMESSKDEKLARASLLANLRSIRRRFDSQRLQLAAAGPSGPIVTNHMEELSSRSVKEKGELYRVDRIQDQINWYSSKATLNARLESRWSTAVLALEGLAAALALASAAGNWPVSPASLLAVLATAAVGWAQTKRFSDLAMSYSIAAEDLQIILDSSKSVRTIDELLRVVHEAEDAISREHSLWRARRGLSS